MNPKLRQVNIAQAVAELMVEAYLRAEAAEHLSQGAGSPQLPLSMSAHVAAYYWALLEKLSAKLK